MFSVQKALTVANGYLPDLRMIYERIMSETKEILSSLEARFNTFSQQQFTFVTALDRCRVTAFEPQRPISTLFQVNHYFTHISDHRTDKRVLNMFLVLVKDLSEFRRTLMKLTQHHDHKLAKIFAKWKKILDSRQDISKLRVQYPYSHINHLSCDEAWNHFGGIISVLPIAIRCAKQALERLEAIRAYRPIICAYSDNPTCQSPCARPPRQPKNKNKANQTIPHQYCRKAQPPSPAVSSPVPTPTHSHHALRCVESSTSLRSHDVPMRQCTYRSRPASAEPAYCRKNAEPAYCRKGDEVGYCRGDKIMYARRKAKPGVSCQTPKYLGSTLMQPVLAWTNQTLSELEMRRLLRERRQNLVRPQWRP